MATSCRRAPRTRGWLAILTIAAGVASGSCTTVGSDPQGVIALSFDSIPPSVIVRDTLRDSLGVPFRLRATAFNSRGDVIVNPAIRFLSLDTLRLRVDSLTGFAVARDSTGPVRIVADAGSLQSIPITVEVIIRPDAMEFSGDSVLTILYAATDGVTDVQQNTTTLGASVKVLHDSAGASPVPVRSVLVRYQVLYHNVVDTLVAFAVDDQFRASHIDTTGTDGVASRRVRIHPGRLAKAVDTVVVLASARSGRAALRGSPKRFLVVLSKKP